MDISGTRRFFVIPIEKIFIDESLNVDNIYLQAFSLFKSKFKYWFDDEDITQIELMNEDFKMRTMEEDLVLDYYRKPENDDYVYDKKEENEEKPKRVKYLSATQIANLLCKKAERLNVNNSVIRNIGKALSSNGFVQSVKRIEGGEGTSRREMEPRKLWNVVELEDGTKVMKDKDDQEEIF